MLSENDARESTPRFGIPRRPDHIPRETGSYLLLLLVTRAVKQGVTTAGGVVRVMEEVQEASEMRAFPERSSAIDRTMNWQSLPSPWGTLRLHIRPNGSHHGPAPDFARSLGARRRYQTATERVMGTCSSVSCIVAVSKILDRKAQTSQRGITGIVASKLPCRHPQIARTQGSPAIAAPKL